MDGKSTTFHTTEPGHLTLGKLMDSNLQLAEHLIVSGLTYYIFRNKLIL